MIEITKRNQQKRTQDEVQLDLECYHIQRLSKFFRKKSQYEPSSDWRLNELRNMLEEKGKCQNLKVFSLNNFFRIRNLNIFVMLLL